MSKAALVSIGKIACFQQTLKDNSFVLDKTGKLLSCTSGNDGSVCISRNITRTQTKNTIHSTNDIEDLFEITILELPKMIKKQVV